MPVHFHATTHNSYVIMSINYHVTYINALIMLKYAQNHVKSCNTFFFISNTPFSIQLYKSYAISPFHAKSHAKAHINAIIKPIENQRKPYLKI